MENQGLPDAGAGEKTKDGGSVRAYCKECRHFAYCLERTRDIPCACSRPCPNPAACCGTVFPPIACPRRYSMHRLHSFGRSAWNSSAAAAWGMAATARCRICTISVTRPFSLRPARRKAAGPVFPVKSCPACFSAWSFSLRCGRASRARFPVVWRWSAAVPWPWMWR